MAPSWSGITIFCPDAPEAAILEACQIAVQRLDQLTREPLTARMVEEALSASAAEIRCWSKDGRLRTAGRAFFSKGHQSVALFTYAPNAVRELVNDPAKIASWRQADDAARSSTALDNPPQRK